MYAGRVDIFRSTNGTGGMKKESVLYYMIDQYDFIIHMAEASYQAWIQTTATFALANFEKFCQ